MSKENILSTFNFSSQSFWDAYYKRTDFKTNDWYLQIEKIPLKKFNFSKYTSESEILMVGIGTSSIIDYLIECGYKKVIFVDFCEDLINYLSDKYLNNDKYSKITADWDCKIILVKVFKFFNYLY